MTKHIKVSPERRLESSRINQKLALAKNRENAEARYAKILELVREGNTGSDISKILGVSTRMVDRARAWGGLNKPARRISEAEYAKAQALLEDGCSYGEAARTVGISVSRLSAKFPLLGWSNGRDGSGKDDRSVEYIKAVKGFNKLTGKLGETKGSGKTDKFITG